VTKSFMFLQAISKASLGWRGMHSSCPLTTTVSTLTLLHLESGIRVILYYINKNNLPIPYGSYNAEMWFALTWHYPKPIEFSNLGADFFALVSVSLDFSLSFDRFLLSRLVLHISVPVIS
jgi:hypothetical protein